MPTTLQELTGILNAMRSEADTAEEDARQEFQSQLDEVRNRDTEEYNVLKITLEQFIEARGRPMQAHSLTHKHTHAHTTHVYIY